MPLLAAMVDPSSSYLCEAWIQQNQGDLRCNGQGREVKWKLIRRGKVTPKKEIKRQIKTVFTLPKLCNSFVVIFL